MMKRLIAIMLSLMLAAMGGLSAWAEQGAAPPQMPGGWPADGQMPQMPGDGQMPEGFDMSSFGGSSGAGGFPGMSQEKTEGQLGSWSMGGKDAASPEGDDYAYDAALYVTAEGVDAEKSALNRVSAGTYDGGAAEGVVIDDSATGHNGILVKDAEYIVSGAEITLLTDADGTDTCDFSGKGAAIAAFGETAKVTVANLVNDNGGNAIHVTLEDGAVWQVTGTSLISSLTIGEGCRVIVPADVTLTVNGTAYTDCTLTETK